MPGTTKINTITDFFVLLRSFYLICCDRHIGLPHILKTFSPPGINLAKIPANPCGSICHPGWHNPGIRWHKISLFPARFVFRGGIRI